MKNLALFLVLLFSLSVYAQPPYYNHDKYGIKVKRIRCYEVGSGEYKGELHISCELIYNKDGKIICDKRYQFRDTVNYSSISNYYYNSLGQRDSVIHENVGSEKWLYIYTYGKNGKMKEELGPDGYRGVYNYDSIGNLVSVWQYNLEGKHTNTDTTAYNNISQVVFTGYRYSDLIDYESFVYNEFDSLAAWYNIKKLNDAPFTVDTIATKFYDYDFKHRKIAERFKDDRWERYTTYMYNTDGSLIKIHAGGDRVFTYFYNKDGLLIEDVTDLFDSHWVDRYTYYDNKLIKSEGTYHKNSNIFYPRKVYKYEYWE